MELFTLKFKERLLSMPFEKEEAIGVRACQLLVTIQKFASLFLHKGLL